MTRGARAHASPLRYPGGKAKVVNFIKLLFIENDLAGSAYVEPFAGGASVALSLLFEDYADSVLINDLDPSVYAFWRAVLDETDQLCQRISDTPVTIETWRRQRAVQRSTDVDPLDLAFSTFFLNRTNRSGIIAGGGVIGGLDQAGKWKLDARYNRVELIRRIEKVARFGSRIRVESVDGGDLIESLDDRGLQRAFVYCDPPYYVKGADLYQNALSDEDHRRIAASVARLRTSWMVSYDDAPEIRVMYERWRSIRYGLQYSAAERQLGAEVMFFSDGLTLPDAESPAGISAEVVAGALRA